MGKHLSCSSHATLYLIKYKKNIVVITYFSYAFYKFFCCRIYSAFTLNRFKNNGTGLVIYQFFYAVKIVELCKLNASDKWFKRLLILIISRN